MSLLRRLLALPPLALGLYLGLTVVVSGFALGSFAKIFQPYLAVVYDYRTEALMVCGQVAFQWLFMVRRSWPERKTYAVIALTISGLGSILLLPLLAYAAIWGTKVPAALAYFLGVVAIIFIAHHRLIQREQLPNILTATWVLYRLLLLAYLTSKHLDVRRP